MENYSQYKQDLFINKIISKRNGYFLDIGANGGVVDSNSYFLEKYKNWNGICVEPIFDKYQILKSIRKAKCYNIGVSNINGFKEFYYVKGYAEMLSGIVSNFNDEHFDRLKTEIKIHGGEIEIISIEVKSINELHEENNVKKVDYCSIDTEGSEFDIIQNIDFSKYKILCFSIENNYQDYRIQEFLYSKNYVKVNQLGNDEIYLYREEYRKILVRLKLFLFAVETHFSELISRININVKKLFLFKKLYKKFLIWRHNNLLIRDFTTDEEVFDYVFIEGDHRPSFRISRRPIILDLGANVGFSAVDLINKYPNAKIYCYELDSSNYEVLIKNTSSFQNIFPFNKAIWVKNEKVYYDKSLPCDAMLIDNTFKSGGSTLGITIEKIFEENELEFVDYIKMDIEGAEVEIFNNDLGWLGKTKSIKVEIHQKEHFDFIFGKLLFHGFKVWKDSKHWSTICAVR